MPPVLAIVVPCYNEEEVLPVTAKVLADLLRNMIAEGGVAEGSYVCFVNDGSRDRTWEIIDRLSVESPLWRGINLSRNFGHQSALLAGLYTAKADIYVSIDADLQDDEQKIRDMVRLYREEGKDIVYGCRDKRQTDTWFKRTTAECFYKLRGMMGCYTIPNHADYRLMSARAVGALRGFGEVNLYLRGIVPMIGFPSGKVFYDRKLRELGESKYPISKMLKLAWNGIVNFSEAPLQMVLWAGLLGVLVSLFLIVWVAIAWLSGQAVHGWASTLVVVSFFGSLQFCFMGVMGLYLGKVFRETKHRPLYVVQDTRLPE